MPPAASAGRRPWRWPPPAPTLPLNDLRFPAEGGVAAEVAALGRRALPLPADVSDQAAVEAMVERTVAELGRLDIFVSSAVYSDREPFTTADMAGFRKTIDVSMWGSFYALRAACRQMIRQGQGGAVVIVSSPHSEVAFPNCMAYNMAKAAQDQMARTAAIELLKHKIRVNILHPGWTDTPGERKYFSEDDLEEGRRDAAGGPAGHAGGNRPRRSVSWSIRRPSTSTASR